MLVDSTRGGQGWRGRVLASHIRLGWPDTTLLALERNGSLPVVTSPKVLSSTSAVSFSGKITNLPEPGGVLVKLTRFPTTYAVPDEWRIDTLSASFPDRIIRAVDTVSRRVEPIHEEYYVRTNAAGEFRFDGLEIGEAYSVVPLKTGWEFGTSQGTNKLGESKEYNFKAKPHQLHLLSSEIYRQIKEEEILVVRTPSEFRSSFLISILLFFGSFFLLHAVWTVKGFRGDPFILPLLMVLTGLGIMTLFSLQDPLRDMALASTMCKAIPIGLLGLYFLSRINYARMYNSPLFDVVGYRVRRKVAGLPGYTWLIFALGFPFLLLTPMGFGPEGSGVKVNLNLVVLSFQPSELTKFIFVFFLAAYFASQSPFVRGLENIKWRVQSTLWAWLGLVGILGLYLVLGDMGPALVLGFTFLLFYSISRGDLPEAILGGIVFGILLKGASWLVGGSGSNGFQDALIAATAAYFVAVIIYGLVVKRVQDSALMIGSLIGAVTLGDLLPYVGKRLIERKAMWLNPWDNEVYGGDHLAHSIWSLASGGFSGQGLGNGFANVMPASHTDMILASMAEEIGWVGLFCFFVLFALLIYRSLLIGRSSGVPFTFYLASGVALVTGVQLLLIACGAFGLLPLTGVSVPFLSYGMTSLVINLAAFGIVLGVSCQEGQSIQKESLQNQYDTTLLAGLGLISGVIVILLGWALTLQLFQGKRLIIEPALVSDRLGKRIYSYNPRITLLVRRLEAGTLFDRKGVILATSTPNQIQEQLDSLNGLQRPLPYGLAQADLLASLRKRQARYYPHGNHLFYWLGDFNTRTFWGSDRGYFAESEHLSQLRGFDSHPSKPEGVFATRFREGRFMKEQGKTEMTHLIKYDYAELAPLLRAGIRSQEVEEFKAIKKDMTLTVDAELQVRIQGQLETAMYGEESLRDKRISVVVIDAPSGDVLASAIHPLPDLSKPDLLDLSEKEQFMQKLVVSDRDLGATYATQPGSTAKIITALAALNQEGIRAASRTFIVPAWARIRDDEPSGTVNMHDAIEQSSNIYFIRLANELQLDEQLIRLYQAAGLGLGVRIQFPQDRSPQLRLGNYTYMPSATDSVRASMFREVWQRQVLADRRNLYEQDERIISRRPSYPKRYQSEFSQLTWGQGKLVATPLALARVAGAIANNGIMRPSRYVVQEGELASAPLWQAQQPGIAPLLASFMRDQARANTMPADAGVAGKSGTPQRDLPDKTLAKDGWFVFFAPNRASNSQTVVCIRVELGETSGAAMALAKQLIPTLQELGYIRKIQN